MRNIFSLTREELTLPDANLIGYNIYKEDILLDARPKLPWVVILIGEEQRIVVILVFLTQVLLLIYVSGLDS